MLTNLDPLTNATNKQTGKGVGAVNKRTYDFKRGENVCVINLCTLDTSGLLIELNFPI